MYRQRTLIRCQMPASSWTAVLAAKLRCGDCRGGCVEARDVCSNSAASTGLQKQSWARGRTKSLEAPIELQVSAAVVLPSSVRSKPTDVSTEPMPDIVKVRQQQAARVLPDPLTTPPAQLSKARCRQGP